MKGRPITEDDLHAHLDGQLAEARRAEVAAYLDGHPEITARLARDEALRQGLRAALDPVAHEPVPTRLNLAHLAARRAAPRWRSAAAAVLLLTLGGAGGWTLRDVALPPAEGVAALAREATDSYVTFAADRIRPVELRAPEMGDFMTWAAAHLQRPPRVPDLSASGYRLMGGRIVTTPHGPGMMLMYDDDRGSRLVMLSRPMAADQDRPMLAHAEGDVGSWSWAASGIGYSLVGSLPAERLHPLADEVRRQVTKGV